MSENFDWKFYLEYYKDITRPCLTKNQYRCFKHYQKFGKKEGKKFTKITEERSEEAGNMNWKQYIKDYPDLMVEVERNERGANFHYNKIGKKENRLCNPEMLKNDIRNNFLKILERKAREEDVNVYYNERIQGKSIEWMINQLITSEEKKKLDKKKYLERRRKEIHKIEKMIKKCFKEILEREPDEKSLVSYSDQVFLGLKESEIRKELENCEEKKLLEENKIKKKKKRAEIFIKRNYYNILNRKVSDDELKINVKKLINGDIEKNEDLLILIVHFFRAAGMNRLHILEQRRDFNHRLANHHCYGVQITTVGGQTQSLRLQRDGPTT